MNVGRNVRRNFLFLQGPPGPFFLLLGRELVRRGCGVFRINLSGGDRYDWPGATADYRGRMMHWPLYFDEFVQRHGVTDVVLYGDCRPVHQAALRLAQLRGLHVHVFEEGYIRPDWMTLERDGVNGHSRLDRDPEVILAAADWLPDVPSLPRITAAFSRRARDSYWHYHHVVLGRWRFPFYRTHRPASIIGEGIGWLLRFARSSSRARQAQVVLDELAGRAFFLFPLQLDSDTQIRLHSPFAGVADALRLVIESFAHHAAPGTRLVVKEHPLDNGVRDWRQETADMAELFGVADRVDYMGWGDIVEVARIARGMVTINSTSGTLGLAMGVPVIALGYAIYDIPGITCQGGLDDFWTNPVPPDAATFAAFRRVLIDKCLIPGGFFSDVALEKVVRHAIARLEGRTMVPE